MGRPPVMEVIPLQSSAEVTMVAPPPTGAGKEDEIVAPRVPGQRSARFAHVVRVGGGQRGYIGVRERGH
jgi:hypothetical protein